MEAIGAAASIIGILELAQTVMQKTYKYAKAYKDASESLKALRTELAALVQVLSVLGDADEEDKELAEARKSLTVAGGPIWLCNGVLQNITKKLPEPKQKIDGLARALWPFKEQEMKEHLAKLERAKSI